MRVLNSVTHAARLLPAEQVVAVTLWGEARCEPIEGIVAVANVIRNRVKDTKRWARSYTGVCLAPYQFSCWEAVGGAANHARVAALVDELTHHTVPDSRTWRQCAWVARGMVEDAFADNTGGANHYHTTTLVPLPSWARHQVPSAHIGAHLFYRL